jgi:uncharacterized protein YcbX
MAITVSALNIYPVKGLGGIALERSVCTERGLEHDRRWMVVDHDGVFMTQRGHPRMATIWTELEADALVLSAPDRDEVRVPKVPSQDNPITVQVWKSTCRAIAASPEADAWLTDYLDTQCRLVYMPESTHRTSNPQYAGNGKLVGFADGYAYLVVGEASLAALNERLGTRGHGPLPMNRFRPNIVLSGSAAFAEDGFADMRMGEAVLRSAKPCGRCEVTTTDQATGERRGPEPLATLATFRDSHEFGVMFGMNYVTLAPGAIAVGDAVTPA